MPQREKEQEEFVVTDRRKFRFDGEELAPGGEAPASAAAETQASEAEQPAPPMAGQIAEPQAEQRAATEPATEDVPEPAAPSDEDTAAARDAYHATAERMDDLMRANNPGAPHDGPVNFMRVIQSLYVTAIVQLGLNTPPGQQMRVDLMGARHTVDMLGVLAEKTKGNTTPDEDKLLQTALFELRMSFLEVTQALAQNAQARAAGTLGQQPGGSATGVPGKIIL